MSQVDEILLYQQQEEVSQRGTIMHILNNERSMGVFTSSRSGIDLRKREANLKRGA